MSLTKYVVNNENYTNKDLLDIFEKGTSNINTNYLLDNVSESILQQVSETL